MLVKNELNNTQELIESQLLFMYKLTNQYSWHTVNSKPRVHLVLKGDLFVCCFTNRWHVHGLMLWACLLYSLATVCVYRQSKPIHSNNVSGCNNNKWDEWRQLELAGSGPAKSCFSFCCSGASCSLGCAISYWNKCCIQSVLVTF